MVIGKGSTDRFLSQDEIRDVFVQGLAQIETEGQRLLFIIPDSTRSGPIPLCFKLITEILHGVADKVDFMIALGTHMFMDEVKVCEHLDITPEQLHGQYADVNVYNHDWQSGLKTIGTITEDETRELSGGRLVQEVAVEVNEQLWDYDRVIIVGPVFPHEIAGFSGGNKYFFPGVSGPDIINFTHWLGAVIGNVSTIGVEDTPVRAVLNRAAEMIDVPKSCFSMVVKGHHDLNGLYFGSPEASQRKAAELSAQVNVTYEPKAYKTILSVMPELYDDVWTAGKGMYKLEPVLAEGGTLIIYAPHIDEVSYTHGEVLDRIGYHVRDYFLAHMQDRYADEPKGVMAHATHVRGAGTYENGVESPRATVVLATRVPPERCAKINLGYMDPDTIDVDEWLSKDDPDLLVVPRAGELLYRLESERPA